MLVHSFSPRIQETEAGGFKTGLMYFAVPGQPGLHRESLSQKKKRFVCSKIHDSSTKESGEITSEMFH